MSRPTFRRHYLAAVFTCIALLFSTGPAIAAPPGAHLNITEVSIDFDAGSIWIKGEDFDFGGPLAVSLGELGDITGLCGDVDLSGLPQLIHCDFSGIGLPADGDYLLTVATGNGQSKSDEYDLTIGAVGPRGDDGIDGIDGADGMDGADGQDAAPCSVMDNLDGTATLSCPDGTDVLIPVASPSPVCTVDGLVGHWPLDGDATDATGNGHDGTLIGDVGFASGVVGEAALFDGQDDRILVAGKVPYQNSFTFAGWLKISGPSQGDWVHVFAKKPNCNNSVQSLGLFQALDLIHVDASDFASPWFVNAPVSLQEDEWYHLATTATPGSVRVFLDGVLIASEALTGVIDQSCFVEHAIGGMGAGFIGGPWSTNGLIDDVRVYDRALSDSEIAELAGPCSSVP